MIAHVDLTPVSAPAGRPRRAARTAAGLLLIAGLAALAGCDDPAGADGQPGTVAVHMDGRVGTYVGATSTR